MHHLEKNYDLKYKIITVSSSRNLENDLSGKLMEKLIKNGYRTIVKDDEVQILNELFNDYYNYDVFIYIGGTGISRLDQTSIAVRKIADKEIKGFGELFRVKSGGIFPYISDASLFIYKNKIIFTLPGSENAQETAHNIINEIINHLYYELNKE